MGAGGGRGRVERAWLAVISIGRGSWPDSERVLQGLVTILGATSPPRGEMFSGGTRQPSRAEVPPGGPC